MLSLWWHLFKLLRYLLPFLSESMRDDGTKRNDPDDDRKKHNLRKLFYGVFVKIALFGIFCYSIFNVSIPLYSENIYLREELKQREMELQESRKLAEKANNVAQEATANMKDAINRGLARDNENKRLADSLLQCHDDLAELRHWVRQNNTITTKPNATKPPVSKEDVKPKPKQVTQSPTKQVSTPSQGKEKASPAKLDDSIYKKFENIE